MPEPKLTSVEGPSYRATVLSGSGSPPCALFPSGMAPILDGTGPSFRYDTKHQGGPSNDLLYRWKPGPLICADFIKGASGLWEKSRLLRGIVP